MGTCKKLNFRNSLHFLDHTKSRQTWSFLYVAVRTLIIVNRVGFAVERWMGTTKNEMVRGYTNTYALCDDGVRSEDDSSSIIIVDPIIALKRGFYRKRLSNDACFSPTESVGENGRNDGQTIAFRLHI